MAKFVNDIYNSFCFYFEIVFNPCNSFLASGNLCCLLITFANSLDPDQDRQNIGPDLDPNRLTLIYSVPEYFFLILILKEFNR